MFKNKKTKTVATAKSTATIAKALRKVGSLNAVQKHIHARAGTWKGKLSGIELLKRTRAF
jgi:hypothetical protein